MPKAANRCLYAAVLTVVAGTCWDLADDGASSSSHWAGMTVLMLVVVAVCIDALACVLREDRLARVEAERCREQRAHGWADRILEETDALLSNLTSPPPWREPAPGDVSMRDPLDQSDLELVFLQQRGGRADGNGHAVRQRDRAAT